MFKKGQTTFPMTICLILFFVMVLPAKGLKTSYFSLEGQAGDGQKETYILVPCKGDNFPQKYSCDISKRKKVSLNQRIKIPLGLYYLVYEGTLKFIEVKQKSMALFLETLEFETYGEGFSVIVDLLSPRQQKKLLLFLWSHSENQFHECQRKKHLTRDSKDYCSYVLSQNFQEHSQLVKFTEEGHWWLLSLDSQAKKKWHFLGSPLVSLGSNRYGKTFLSVVPGGFSYKVILKKEGANIFYKKRSIR